VEKENQENRGHGAIGAVPSKAKKICSNLAVEHDTDSKEKEKLVGWRRQRPKRTGQGHRDANHGEVKLQSGLTCVANSPQRNKDYHERLIERGTSTI